MTKDLERKNGIFGTIIYENKGNLGEKGGERSQVAREEENEGK